MYMRQLDKAGIPFCVCAANSAALAIVAAEYVVASGVPHTIVLQITPPQGAALEPPDTSLPAEQVARQCWEGINRMLSSAPSLERHKGLIWLEPAAEIDTDKHVEFLGWFSYHLGQMANEQGYKVALPGHKPGQPEPEHWRLPGYQAFLRACSERPEMLAVSFHEGTLGDMAVHLETFYPYRIGRFTWMYDACDELGIDRPTTFITKWSWGETDMPRVENAMRDVLWLSELAAKYATLRGMFLWGLGGDAERSTLAGKLQKLIAPLTEYVLQARLPGPAPRKNPVLLGHRPVAPTASRSRLHQRPATRSIRTEPARADQPQTAGPRGKPRAQYKRVYVLLPPQAGKKWVHAVAEATWEMFGYTMGKNPDDAGIGDLESNTVLAVNPHLWGPGEDGSGLEGFFARYYPAVTYRAIEAKTPHQLRAMLPG
jgi:hypothetical protein